MDQAGPRIGARTVFVLPSFAGGGAERVLLTLLAGAAGHGFVTDLVVMNGQGPLVTSLPVGVPVHDLRCTRLRHALPGLAAILRRIRPDVIVSTLGYMNLALLALRPFLHGRPRIFVREANIPSQSIPTTPWPSLFRIGYRMLYRQADAVICSSKLIGNELRRDFSVPDRLLHYLANPVDVESIRRAASAPRRAPGPGPRFVAAGRLTHQKGFDRLLDMLTALPADAHVTIFGEGQDGPALVSQANRLGVSHKVQFAGFETNPWPFFAGADAFLLPSRWEGMPNVALEALACGTPVIATPESGGLLEVAGETPFDAVTVAEAGNPFVEAMAAVKPDPCAVLRRSLLPARFAVEAVTAAFTTLLAQMPESSALPVRSR